MAIEFATGYVSLIPSLKGAGKSISSQLGGISMAPIGAKMGNALGATLGAGVKTSMKSQISSAIVAPVNKALDAQATATRNLGTAEMDLSKARAKQQSAQAKVATAEEKLATLRASGTASSGELKAAEADLNAAKVALADSNLRVGSSEDAATRAKEAATSANSAYIDSLKKSSTITGRLETALPVIGARIQEVGGKWKSTGAQISSVGKTMTAKFTAPVVAAGTAVAGLAIGLGFKRLVGIDTARGQFKGLGYDADKVMDQVDKGVTNTALSMADGASMAVGILATGAVPMEKLESQIKRTANVSAAYGVDASHAGNLLNQVLTKNKVTYGDLSQMQANGIPIISQLADHYGVAGDAIQKMAADGKISIDDMNTVLDKNAGAAAEEYAKTWKGVTSNIKSNIGKLGADFLGGVFPQLKEQAEGLLDVLKSDAVRGFAKDLGEKLANAVKQVIESVKAAIGWWNNLSPAVQKFIGVAAGVVLVAGPMLMLIGKIVMTVGGLITAFGSIVSAVGAAIPVIKALNLVMKANVIGIVITAVAALVGALIWFFTQTELGRTIWGGFVNWLKDLWSGVSKFFTALWDGISEVFGGAWSGIVDFFTSSGNGISEWWTGRWTGISDFFTGIWDGILAVSKAFASWFMDTFGPTLEAAWNALIPVFESGAQMVSDLTDLISRVVGWMVDKVTASLDWLGAKWAGFISMLSDLWQAIGVPFIEWVKSGWEAFTSFVSGVWDTAKQAWANFVDWLASIWQSVGVPLIEGIKVLWAMFASYVSGIFEKVAKAFSTFVSGLSFIWRSIGEALMAAMRAAWEGAKAVFSVIWETIKNVFSGVLGVIKGIFDMFSALFRGDWAGMWRAVKDIAANIWKIISSAIGGAIKTVFTIIKSYLGVITAFWSSAWGSIREFFSRVWSHIVSAASSFGASVKQKFTSVTDFVKAIPGKIIGFFTGLGGKLVASGKSLIGGFLDGIMAGFNKAKQAVSDGLGKIRSLFPFSPAKEGPFSGRGWVAYSGLSLGATFTETIADSLADGRKDITDELGGIQDEFDDFSNDGFRVSTSVPDYGPEAVDGAGVGAAGDSGPLIHIAEMIVDSPDRAKQVAQELYTRASRASRSSGKVLIGGAVS